MIRKFVNGKWEPPFSEEEERENARRFDDMVASGRTPGIMTDSVFLEGHCNGNQFERRPDQGDFYAQEAAKAGVDPKGKVYLGGLARFPGDPEAWVSGRGDVRRACERRGWGCAGAVEVKPREAAPAAPAPLGEDIVANEVERVVAEAGDVREVNLAEVREEARERLTPHWDK